jgi:hypothetical protein
VSICLIDVTHTIFTHFVGLPTLIERVWQIPKYTVHVVSWVQSNTTLNILLHMPLNPNHNCIITDFPIPFYQWFIHIVPTWGFPRNPFPVFAKLDVPRVLLFAKQTVVCQNFKQGIELGNLTELYCKFLSRYVEFSQTRIK